MDNDEVLHDPIYLEQFRKLLAESNRKFTGFDDEHNVLVLDVTDSKTDLLLLTMLAQEQWELDTLIPSIAPRLKEVHLCEGMRVWSGAGGRQLRHKYRDDVPFKWWQLWPGRMRIALLETKTLAA